jgi:hypothetical protein
MPRPLRLAGALASASRCLHADGSRRRNWAQNLKIRQGIDVMIHADAFSRVKRRSVGRSLTC